MKNTPSGLCSLKSRVDKLDIGKFETSPVDLSKLSNVVKMDVVKMTEYNAKIKNIEDKIPNTTNLTTKTTLNAKINEVKGEIPSITNLAITTAFTAAENKIPNVSNLVKNTDYNTKINKIRKRIIDHGYDKYITTPKFNKLTAKYFAARLTQTNLASKIDIANFVKKTNFDEKIKI